MKYSGSLATKLQTRLRTLLGRDAFLMDGVREASKLRKSAPQPIAEVRLAATGESRNVMTHPEVWYLPIALAVEPARLWFGIRARFAQSPGANVYELDSVSLYFARGEQDLRMLVRAEWDRRALGREADHGQPHWHVHPGGPSEANAVDPVDAYWDRITEHLHLAMAASWGVEDSREHAYKCALESDDKFIEWLAGCFTYLRSQIEYAVGKVRYPSDNEATQLTEMESVGGL
jgi:hypothetical protein